MSTRRKQRENRRRTGCFQCKEKHIQCTEEKPQCARCARLGLKCERGLKLIFKEDAVQKGIYFGREGAWRKRPKNTTNATVTDAGNDFHSFPLSQYRGCWIFLNTTCDDFIGRRSDFEDMDTGTDKSTQLLPSAAVERSRFITSQPWDHPLTSYSEVESYLLDYFIRGIGPYCSLSPSENPYISLIIPLCFVHTTLRHTLLAVAANQLRLLEDTRFVKEACIFKDRALQGLQQAMSSNCFDHGVIATVLMLCFHDISDGCDPSWLTHLRGGLKLIACAPLDCTESDSLKRFFTMYFVAHDIMSRTARDRWEDESSSSWLQGDDMNEIDVVMGCSRSLMSLINRISNLASQRIKILDCRKLNPTEIKHFTSAFIHIESSLHALRQTLPKNPGDKANLTQIAETKRLAAILYLAERLPVAPTQTGAGLDGSIVSPSTMQQSPKLKKRRLVSSIINIISTLPDSTTLLWPLYVLGNCGLENEEERRFVLDRLGKMQQMRNLGSVRLATLAMKRSFRISDLDHPCGRVWGDDWCGFISLA